MMVNPSIKLIKNMFLTAQVLHHNVQIQFLDYKLLVLYLWVLSTI